MTVTNKLDGKLLTIYLEGRIDSSNAGPCEAEVFKAIEENPHEELIIDVDKLEYISSAGLRIILKVRKTDDTLKVINASSDVYDIFDMTGFTEMIDVVKAYRKLSVEGCEVIGQGANGKVYRLDPDTIIKVYMNPNCLDDIKNERELARRAFVLGIPTAIPYDVVRVGETYGSVFELLNAKPFNQLVKEDPENLEHYVDLSVEILKKMHSTVVKETDMPDEKEVVLGWASFLKDYLPEAEANKFFKMVADVPVVHTMMHGDYHVKNIMMQNGEVLLIDMDTLCQGYPIFEFASIFNAYCGFSEGRNNAEKFLGITQKQADDFYMLTLQKYFEGKSKEEIEAISDKARCIGYARILRRQLRRLDKNNPEQVKEVEHFQARAIEYINKVDNLLF